MIPAILDGRDILPPIITQADEPPPFLKLPAEMILAIFEKLDPSTIRRLELTCWKFNVSIQGDSLWKTLFKRDFPTCLRPPLPSFRSSYAHRQRFHDNFVNGVYTTRIFQGNRNLINTFTVADGYVITGSNDIEIFDLVMENSRILDRRVGPVIALAVIGDRLFSGSMESTINVYNLSYFEKTLTGHGREVTCLGSYGDNLISGSMDNTVRIWDVATGESQCLEGHTKGISTLVVAPDGKLYTGSYDGTIGVWDLKTKEFLFFMEGHKHRVMSLALDGDNLISGSLGEEIKIWDLEKRSCLETLADTREVFRLASIEGKFVSSSGRLWDSRQRKSLYTIDVASSDLVMQNDKLFMSAGLRILIFDFHAKDSEIFREIAEQLKQPKNEFNALVRFQRMPEVARKKIHEKLRQITAKESRFDPFSIVNSWHCAPASRQARAIEAYLDEVKK